MLPVAGIGYAGPRGYGVPPLERVGVSGFGVASLSMCFVTLAYSAFCGVMLARARADDWEFMLWTFFGIVGNWVCCGVGFVLGLVGVCQTRKAPPARRPRHVDQRRHRDRPVRRHPRPGGPGGVAFRQHPRPDRLRHQADK